MARLSRWSGCALVSAEMLCEGMLFARGRFVLSIGGSGSAQICALPAVSAPVSFRAGSVGITLNIDCLNVKYHISIIDAWKGCLLA
jgi:hypothetical protein